MQKPLPMQPVRKLLNTSPFQPRALAAARNELLERLSSGSAMRCTPIISAVQFCSACRVSQSRFQP